MVLKNARVFLNGTFQEDKAIVVKDSHIEAILPNTEVTEDFLDLEGKYILPGLVDLQLNGAAGHFFANDISEKSIRKIQEVHLKYGTTGFLITLTTSAYDNIFKAIETVRAYQHKYKGLLGLHVEGPYLNPEKKGAHPIEFIRKPDFKELHEILEAGADVIKMITIAPELFDKETFKLLIDSGITIAAGHSMATYSEAVQSFENGITMVTHLYNAMSPLESRAPGLVGATLNHDAVHTSIIADGKHVDYAAINLAYRLKKDKLLLISDAAFKEEEGREFQFGATKVIEQEGFYYTDEGRLAGSSISMFEALVNVVKHAQIPLEEAIQMASIRAASLIGAQTVGSIAQGLVADFLIVNENLELEEIIFQGKGINNRLYSKIVL